MGSHQIAAAMLLVLFGAIGTFCFLVGFGLIHRAGKVFKEIK